ncbi:hypothetical protein [Sulfitobacter sp.]|uniref:hypothetical protein n=1 Tax=Sulfitobacter sp. TaxID=1903071 RepID=UPI0030038398
MIEAVTGGNVWAKSFDRAMVDSFETQPLVGRAVVTCLAPQIDRAEAVRTRVSAPEDLTAHRLAQRG